MKNFLHIVSILSLIFTTSCAKIAKTVSTPIYSTHGDNQILFNNNKIKNVFIYEATDDIYGIHKNVINEIKHKLAASEIQTVNSANDADYTLSVNIKNISVNLDGNFVENMRNTITSKEINDSYNFDTNNSPHIDNRETTLKEKNNNYLYKRLLPSTLYTTLGSGIGFAIGFTIAGSLSPLAFGILGSAVLGSMTYVTYNSFRKVGIVVSYDIVVSEKNKQTLKHSRKFLTKISSNSSDEIFYSYKDNWLTMVSKNVVTAIGSKVLTKDMITNIGPIIADNAIRVIRHNK